MVDYRRIADTQINRRHTDLGRRKIFIRNKLQKLCSALRQKPTIIYVGKPPIIDHKNMFGSSPKIAGNFSWQVVAGAIIADYQCITDAINTTTWSRLALIFPASVAIHKSNVLCHTIKLDLYYNLCTYLILLVRWLRLEVRCNYSLVTKGANIR